MSEIDDIITRLERLECYIYNEINQLIRDSLKNDVGNAASNSCLLKYKPSKHRKAYKLDKNLKKRCYTR